MNFFESFLNIILTSAFISEIDLDFSIYLLSYFFFIGWFNHSLSLSNTQLLLFFNLFYKRNEGLFNIIPKGFTKLFIQIIVIWLFIILHTSYGFSYFTFSVIFVAKIHLFCRKHSCVSSISKKTKISLTFPGRVWKKGRIKRLI